MNSRRSARVSTGLFTGDPQIDEPNADTTDNASLSFDKVTLLSKTAVFAGRWAKNLTVLSSHASVFRYRIEKACEELKDIACFQAIDCRTKEPVFLKFYGDTFDLHQYIKFHRSLNTAYAYE